MWKHKKEKLKSIMALSCCRKKRKWGRGGGRIFPVPSFCLEPAVAGEFQRLRGGQSCWPSSPWDSARDKGTLTRRDSRWLWAYSCLKVNWQYAHTFGEWFSAGGWTSINWRTAPAKKSIISLLHPKKVIGGWDLREIGLWRDPAPGEESIILCFPNSLI